MTLVACGGGSSAPRTATTPPGTPQELATVAPVATPTIDPLASSEIDGQHVYDVTKKLSVDIGPRVAGTPSEITARDYIQTTLQGYGYDVTLQDFAFDATAFLPARVDVAGTGIPGIALRGSLAGNATGPLVNAGIGRVEDFPAGGARGMIALVQRGDISFSDKVDHAVAAGAAGVIVYNNVPGSLIGDQSTPATIPAEGISQAAGEDLVARLAAAPLDATITVSPPKGTAYNVIARPKGVATCTTVSGGHYDSVAVTGGADDNASGTASVLELARVAAARHLPGANCFALFSAEEFGLFGSKAFVDTLSPDDVNSMRAMINLDVVGVKEDLQLIGDADLIETARVQAQNLGFVASASSLPAGAGSDHLSFQRAGIPVVMLYREDNLIHQPADAIDRILPSSLAATVSVAYETLSKIAGR